MFYLLPGQLEFHKFPSKVKQSKTNGASRAHKGERAKVAERVLEAQERDWGGI